MSDEATQIVENLNKDFHAFKEANNKTIQSTKADILDIIKVDKINESISNTQAEIDKINAALSAMQVGGAGEIIDPAVKEHSQAFENWFRRGVDNGLHDLEIKAKLTTKSDPDGGYFVPTEMEGTIDRVLTTVSALRNLASVRSIGTDTYEKLVNVGGAGAGWVGEEESRIETSTPSLRKMEFNVMEAYAEPRSTQKNLDDSVLSIEAWLADEVAITMAEQEGDAFINGTGVKKPRGILQYDNIANASYSWGKVGYVKSGGAADFASSSPADALVDLVYALRQQYRTGGSFLMNDMTTSKVRKLKDGQGNYLWQPSIQVGTPSTLLGYAVSTDDNMPDVAANAFPIAFANFARAYLILDRQGISVLRDPYTEKPYVKFYTTKRVGGGIQNFEAIKLLKIEA